MRDELLNGELFYTPWEARVAIERWRGGSGDPFALSQSKGNVFNACHPWFDKPVLSSL